MTKQSLASKTASKTCHGCGYGILKYSMRSFVNALFRICNGLDLYGAFQDTQSA